MRYAQVLVYENDTLLTTMLEEKARQEKWSLRHPRDFAECAVLLRRGGPSVLVLRVGRDLEFELSLLERVANLFPDAGTVIVGEATHAALAGLAWDLGADCVLLLPQPGEMLPEVVAGLLTPAGGGEVRS
jgi:DNA-binding response OmpR family regulator